VVRRTAIALLGLWLSGAAVATTYTVVGSTYTTAFAPYTTAMSVTGTFDTASPLPANHPNVDIGPKGSGLVTAWSFSDGMNTFTQANSAPSFFPGGFAVGTDAKGNITSFGIDLESPQPPNAINDVMNTFTLSSSGPDFSFVADAAKCTGLIGNQCNSFSLVGYAFSTTTFAFTPNFTAVPPTIAKSFAPGSVPLNGTTSLTFTLANPDLATTLTGVAFADTFPAGMLVATPNGLANTCGGIATAVQGTGSVSLTGATIASNSSCTLTVNVTTTSIGSLTNTTGSVTSSNSLPGNTASATLGVVAPPSPIPTLQERALWLLGLVLAISGAGLTRHCRSTASRRRG
jgi:hypothetical protein